MRMMKKLSLLLCISIFIISGLNNIVLTKAWPSTRYYAGYKYGNDGYGCGVSSEIYTINPTVPTNNFYCQWVTVVISYTYGYWVQLGYNKNSTTTTNKVYIEVLDSGTPTRHVYWFGHPNSGSTHSYFVWRSSTSTTSWTCTEDSTNLKTVSPSPYSPVDLQAFSESTNSTGLPIDGTHFSYISMCTGSDWYLWSTAYYYYDSCYTMTRDHAYEFHASGGS